MITFDYNKIEKLYLVGDVHGEFDFLLNKIRKCVALENRDEHKRKNDAYNNSVIIVCGDCGFGFNKYEYYNQRFCDVNDLFAATNTTLLFMRGNHDDPSYFSEQKINFSHIKTIPDYSIVITANHNVLCIGGAVSLDRSWRFSYEKHVNKFKKTHKKNFYWENEQICYDENLLREIIESKINIDILATHSFMNYENYEYTDEVDRWCQHDSTLVDDIKKEKESLTNIYNFLTENNLNIKLWVHGHFHYLHQSKYNDTIVSSLSDNCAPSNVQKLLETTEKCFKPLSSTFDAGFFGVPLQGNVYHMDWDFGIHDDDEAPDDEAPNAGDDDIEMEENDEEYL